MSCSDEIRAELRSRGEPINRDNLIRVGNELRMAHGPGVLGQRLAARINAQLSPVVVDSIRNIHEVTELRAVKGFTLVLVDAPVETRFSRVQARARAGDEKLITSLEDFVRYEKTECGKGEHSQQLDRVAKLADITFDNSGQSTPASFVNLIQRCSKRS